MFTGLIEALGRVDRVDPTPSASGRRCRIETTLGRDLQPGDSVAVNGVCLTTIAADQEGFAAELSPETLAVTTLGSLVPGRTVNLERPLRAEDRIGGHFVLGHVDAVGQVAAWAPDGDCFRLEVDCPPAVERFLIPKGSIAVDGISLTVAGFSGARCRIQILPYTAGHTNLGGIRVGDRVNLEADVLGKYVAGLLEARGSIAAARPHEVSR